jgi:hypothetical protein
VGKLRPGNKLKTMSSAASKPQKSKRLNWRIAVWLFEGQNVFNDIFNLKKK